MKFLPLLLVLSFSLPAICEDDKDRAVITYKGVQGYFFSEEVGDKILADLEEFKLTQQKIALLNDKILNEQEKVKLIQLDVEITEKIAGKWKSAFERADEIRLAERKHYDEEMNKRDAWYRAPVLWFSVGFVLASAAAVGLTFGVAELK